MADETPPMSTVGDLMDFLAAQPRDRKVILRKDGEGNGHSPLAEAGEGLYVADSTWSGEMYPTREDVARWVAEYPGRYSEDDWTVPDDGERVVVLGPVN
jgi:hypothetical protein